MTEETILPPEGDIGDELDVEALSDHEFFISTAQFPRRIIAEDPTYNRPEISSLKIFCLNTIVSVYDGSQNLKKLPPYQRHYIIKRLSVNFPILEAIRYISEDIYWQKRCLSQWSFCNVVDYQNSWKVMCLQRTIEHMIEDYMPDGRDLEFSQLKPIIVAANKYIKKLDIKKLKAVAFHDHKAEEDVRENEEFRINFGIILANLPHLEEFHLTYSVSDCGENFHWYMSRLTSDDVLLLQVALLPCYNLRVLHLYKSDLDSDKVNLLMRGLAHLPALEVLKLPNNKIGDSGAFCFSKLLMLTTKLNTLDLSNNQIGKVGAEAIAYGLTKNSTLKELDLRLNYLGENGCEYICKALASNSSLIKLNLSSNAMTEENAGILAKALKYNSTIGYIDLSCNPLISVVGGYHILEGVEHNKIIKELDVRWCNCGQDNEYYLEQLLKRNRSH